MKKSLTALGIILGITLVLTVSLTTKNDSYDKTGSFLAGNNYAKSERGKSMPADLSWGDPTSGMFGSK